MFTSSPQLASVHARPRRRPPSPSVQGPVGTPDVGTGGTPTPWPTSPMYYYQTDLRTPALGNCTGALGNSVCENNVFVSASDNNLQQHMTTFTLGLGVRGRMVYSPSYLTDTTGDFVSVKLGSTASRERLHLAERRHRLQLAGSRPAVSPTTVDDLWHAAVNGRGAYFSATDPVTLATGLANALTQHQFQGGRRRRRRHQHAEPGRRQQLGLCRQLHHADMDRQPGSARHQHGYRGGQRERQLVRGKRRGVHLRGAGHHRHRYQRRYHCHVLRDAQLGRPASAAS